MGNFSQQVKDYLDKGISASKEAIGKAGVVVQELGELGVLRYELEKLISQQKKKLRELGAETYKAFSQEKNEQISASQPPFDAILAELEKLEQDIKKHRQNIAEKELLSKNKSTDS